MQKPVDLARGEQTRFVNDPERACRHIGSSAIFKQRGDGARGDSGRFEFAHAASSRTKTLDPVAAPRGELAQRADRGGLGGPGPALDANHPVVAGGG